MERSVGYAHERGEHRLDRQASGGPSALLGEPIAGGYSMAEASVVLQAKSRYGHRAQGAPRSSPRSASAPIVSGWPLAGKHRSQLTIALVSGKA